MSPRLRQVRPREVVRVLERLGYVRLRQRGSHAFYYHPALDRRTVVPMHSGATIKIGTLLRILEDIELSLEEFEKLL